MASPFVPVDLDKLLDEFEEKEQETKPQLVASVASGTTDNKHLTKRSIQASFPSIEEEVLSDQGSDQGISDDKTDSSSDNDSISGVIREAEAITNQTLLSYQPQTTQGVVADESIINELQEKVVIAAYAPSKCLDGNDPSNDVEEINSGDFEMNEQKQLNQRGHAQLLNDEFEAVNDSTGLCASEHSKENVPLSNVSCFTETNHGRIGVVTVNSELFDEHSTSCTADHEEHLAGEDRLDPVGSGQYQMDSTIRPIELETSNVPLATNGVSGIDQYTVDSTIRPIEPETSNISLAADSDGCFPGLNQALDSLGSLGELTDENIPGLHGEQVANDPGNGDGTYQDSHSSQQCADVETSQYKSCGLADSSSETAPETSWMPSQNVALSGSSPSQDFSHVDSNTQPSMSSQDQLPTLQLDETSASSEGMDNNSAGHLMEVNQVPGAAGDDQSEVTSHGIISPQSESSTDYGQGYDSFGLEAGTLPLSAEVDEQTHSPPEPDLSIAVQSQGTLEARRITAGEANLGKVPPIWVPDSVATHCMNCGVKFSVIKRRHHCRACGKALCSSCCNMKFLLPYMDNKEGRVCQVCCNALLRAQALLQVVENQTTGENLLGLDNDSPTEDLIFDDGLEGDEEVPVDQEEFVEATEGVEDDDTTDFSAAGVDVTSEHSPPVLPPLQLPVAPPPDTVGTPLSTPTSPALSDDSDCLFRLDVDNVRSLLPQDITALPPVLKVINEEVSIQERPDPAEIMYQLKGLHETVVFLLNKNLVVKVSIVKLSCCVKRKCWCFVTEGMGAANQEEMVVLLECLRKETMLPKDVLSHFNTAFAYAKQGHTVSELGYTIFGQPFLGSSDNAGFLYVKPTYQCVKNLPLPSTPYVVGILIKRPETPWAQLFPLRLQLRLGAEYRYYPCPLFSSRNRSAVYGEIGHTIMNLLADFKNFQYTLARVTGLVIHMEEKKTLVRLPQDRYDEVVKILNATDEHVMALGANFSLQADSHLVCIQNEQGYKTQAINIQNQARKVTGASFVVFSGALKTSSPFMAKVNIVEDGIMVQLMPEVIGKLRNSLKEMKDYTITTGIPGGGGEEHVIIEWVSRKDAPHQSSLCSPIDGLQLHGFPSVKVHTGCDFTRKSVFRIQWTEMFFLGDGQQSASRDSNKLTAELAKAFCRTLMPHLSKLSSDGCTCIGLRVNLDNDNVGYFTGSNQQGLPSSIMSDLDDVLVPVIHSAASHHRRRALSVELLFKVLRL